MILSQARPSAESPPGTVQDDNGTPVNPKIKTNLRLTVERLDQLTARIIDRIAEVSSEMGLGDKGMVDANSWMWERQKHLWEYGNQWEWRKALGGIFPDSNYSVNIAKRWARLMSAKTSDDLVGTDPFFAAMPTQHGSPDLAKQVEWYTQEEIGQSNLRDTIKEAEQTAISANEAVVKVTYVLNATAMRGPATVMAENGLPVVTPRGNYIYQKDDIIPDPNVQPDAAGNPQAFVLKKEPNFSMPAPGTAQFAKFDDLDQTLLGYQGLEARVLDFRDFLCPLACNSIHEADINVHLFDEEYSRLKAAYGNFEASEDYFDSTVLSGEKQPKEEKGEQETGSKVLHKVKCADVYIRCDADGDGREEEIWAIFDRVNQKIIWMDYLGNHMKKRPFEVIPGVEKVPNRWYGVGVFEMMEHKQLYIDTQFNRVNYKSSKSSGARFRNKNAVEEWKAGDEVEIGGDNIYNIIDPRFDSKNPPLFQVNLSEIDPFAMELIKLMLQAGSTEMGIVGPNDGDIAGLDTTKLATGIKSLERTGNVLMKFTEQAHGKAIESILDQAVDIIIEHMDDDEVIFREDTQELVALNREEVRRLGKDVRLLLTRSRSTETLETCTAVTKICREYYESLNTFERYKLRDVYIRQLKALEEPDAEKKLEEVTPQQLQAWVAQQNQPPVEPPKTSIATKYTDLERPEQIQVLQREGITPAPVSTVTTHQQQEITQTAAEANAKAKAAADHPKPPQNGSKPGTSKSS